MDSVNPRCSLSESEEGCVSTFEAGSVRIAKIAQFLPPEAHDALYQAACANQRLFHPPGGPGSAVGTTLYWSGETGGGKLKGSPLSEAMEVMGEHILDRLPFIFEALGVDPFPVPRVPLNLIHGLDGHSGSPHADSTNGRFLISLLYYFNKVPKVFRGGDLELYETDGGSTSGHSDEPLTRIKHEDNLLLAFDSNTFHGVTDVRCDSREFADGRFVAVAFLGSTPSAEFSNRDRSQRT